MTEVTRFRDYVVKTAAKVYNIIKPTLMLKDVTSFLYRAIPSGVANGYGRIEKIEGNTLVWNNNTRNNITGTLVTKTGDTYTVSGSTSAYNGVAQVGTSKPVEGHKYYLSAFITQNSCGTRMFLNPNSSNMGANALIVPIGGTGLYHTIVTISSAASQAYIWQTYSAFNGTFSFYAPLIIDLTAIFGAGNEPSTVADFETWLQQNIGTLPYYDYNAGELLSCKMSGMLTEDSSQQILDTLPFDVTTITGINPNTNTREVMFVDGMNITADGNVDVIDLTNNVAERATYLIPSTYQELEYLESDRNAYINLNIYATVNTVVHLKVSDSNSWIFGRTAGVNGRWGLDDTHFYSDYQSVAYTFSGIMDMVCDFSRGLTIDGIDYDFSGTPVNPSNSVMQLFRANGSSAYPRGKIYFFDVYESGVLTMRLIPVRRISDSVLGMYDVVTDTLFTNAGTGSFIAGANAYQAHALDTPITYTDLQDQYGNPLNPRYKVEQGSTEQVLPVNTSTPTTVAPTLDIVYNKDKNVVSPLTDVWRNIQYTVKYLTTMLKDVASFLYRAIPSGVANGYGRIEKVEGNTVVWNQLLKQGKLVDMGLPSGLLWATCNIDITQEDGFAASPFQYGCTMFSWGNIEGHNTPSSGTTFDYNWGGVNAAEPWYAGQPYGNTNGNTLSGNIPVGEEYDAARANLGSQWRMPTKTEFAELFAGCIYIDATGTEIPAGTTDKRVTVNGIVGLYLQSRTNGNRLFFACSGTGNGTSWLNRGSYGFYWSASFYSARDARRLYFGSGGVYPQDYYNRYRGFAVRAVVNPNTIDTGHNNHKYYVTEDKIHDLTTIFGAGNEPTTVADFEAWMAQNIGTLPYYDYNAGELLSCKMSGMQTEDSSQQTLDTIALDVTTITGINPNTNTREVIFASGMKQADYAGTVKDEIDLANRTATVRCKEIDLGSLNYTKQSTTHPFFYATLLPLSSSDKLAIICAHYPTGLVASSGSTTSICTDNNGSQLRIRDLLQEGSSSPDFKTYLSGKKAIYELGTPITYTDLQDANGNPIKGRYAVEQGGTEQVLPANTSTPTTVAPTLEIVYNKPHS